MRFIDTLDHFRIGLARVIGPNRSAMVRGSILFLSFLIFLVVGLPLRQVGAATPDKRRLSSPLLEGDADRARARSDALNVPKKRPVTLPPNTPRVKLRFQRNEPKLLEIPQLKTAVGGGYISQTQAGDIVQFTVIPSYQKMVEQIVRSSRAPHVAVVAVEPWSGRVLALAERSTNVRHLLLHDSLPAASLFKVVTAAAAVEKAGVRPSTKVSFRGGNYTLERWNFQPDRKRDKRWMTIGEAMGKSVNPVFGRLALNFLSPPAITEFATRFGFNQKLISDLPLPTSRALIPADGYGLSRTAAGFGNVRISPIHAAMMMAGLANGGVLPQINLIDSIRSREGDVRYQARPNFLGRMVRPQTAEQVIDMMLTTTTQGTSRREFHQSRSRTLRQVKVAAKTGTLRGKSPSGVNNWFIAAAPIPNPEIAIAAIVVNPKGISSRASHLGRLLLEHHFAERSNR